MGEAADGGKVIPFAPWHRPVEKCVAPGVYVTTTYGSHVLAALVYAVWRWLRRV